MAKIKQLFFILFLFSFSIGLAQSVEIEGQVFGESDVEGIHVINKTSNKNTTTTPIGTFTIYAKLNDTIVFSSIQYKLIAVRVTSETIAQKKIFISLEEHVNVLDEVLVGKVLSGDLELDVKNANIEKPIDFYDVGIPGYTGKPKTQSERRLHEADAGKMIPSIGFGFSVNFYKLINTLSGRTKMLKEHVRLEANVVLMYKIKTELSEEFFKTNLLDEGLIMEFFYFCSEDENFVIRCNGKSQIDIWLFLEEKYDEFKINLNSKD
ncbi:MAG: hypothetical protein ACI83H_001035 [Glaciecola sp.]|jgi:hypothetical protein